jgi:hypothetical protein
MNYIHPDNGRTIKLVNLGVTSCAGCIGRDQREGGDGSCFRLPACGGGEMVFQYAYTFDAPKEEAQLLTEDPDHGEGPPPAAVYKPAHGGYPDVAKARASDPETSHDAAASVGGGKLMDLILQEMQASAERFGGNCPGFTGKEIANYVQRPLNSITPRLAPLRRKGLIHAAGKRDKQIVWKLGNGVAA